MALYDRLNETTSDQADYIVAASAGAVAVMDANVGFEEPPAGTDLRIDYDTRYQGGSAIQVEILEGSTVIKSQVLDDGVGFFLITAAEWASVATWPWTPRFRITSTVPTAPPGPAYIDSALVAQKETEGTTNFSAALASDATAGRTILSFIGLRTAIFTGPPTGNNGNSYTLLDSQAFPSPYTTYSVRSYRAYSVSGGSAHSVTGSKVSGAAEEVTMAFVALDGGTVVDSGVGLSAAAGAGATHTSPTVTTTGPAMLVCMASGTGDVNATAPTQTWPGDWTVQESVAYSSAQAPNGHVPMYLATKSVSAAGNYSVNVQVTIDEGLLFMIYVIQL